MDKYKNMYKCVCGATYVAAYSVKDGNGCYVMDSDFNSLPISV